MKVRTANSSAVGAWVVSTALVGVGLVALPQFPAAAAAKLSGSVDYKVQGFSADAVAAASQGAAGVQVSTAGQARRAKKGKPGSVRKLKAKAKGTQGATVKVTWKKPRQSGATKVKRYRFQVKQAGGNWGKWKTRSAAKLKVGKKKYAKSIKGVSAGQFRMKVRAGNRQSFGPKRKVSLRVGSGLGAPAAGVKVASWSDSYNLNSSQYQSSDGGEGTKWLWYAKNGDLFQDLETTQFVDQLPDYITVTAPDRQQCLSLFDGSSGKPVATARADGSQQIPVSKYAGGQAKQLTIIPWWSKSTSCNLAKDLKSYDERVVLSIFMSKTLWSSPPAGATVCRITKQAAAEINEMYWEQSGNKPWRSADGSCVIDKPQVRGGVYTGTLYTMLTNGDDRPLYIELAPGARLTAPLNSIVAGTSNPQSSDYDRCVLSTNRQIIVTGFGRMDGAQVNKRYQDRYEGPSKPAFYLVDSGQLVLGSRANADFAIDVSGISAANGALRNEASVALNDGNYPHCGPDGTPQGWRPGYEGGPVKVYDFKRPGVWWGASDSLEVSADSVVSNSYFHSADDAIKISAPRQTWRDITVLQGNGGGVINIGSYGYNSGTKGTVVDGVFVPRITQQPWGDRAQWDDRGGLITTRTCAQPNQRGEQQNITGVTIRNLTLPSLGNPGSGNGPNSYIRPFAIGVAGDTNQADTYAIFCNRWGDGPGQFRAKSDVTMGDLKFVNFDLYQNPIKNSLIYDGNQVLPSARSTTWRPIYFCDGSNGSCTLPPPGPNSGADRPVTFWPKGEKTSSSGYYVCGVGSKSQAANCWAPSKGNGPAPGLTPNVDYFDSQSIDESGGGYDLGNKVVFPYG